MKKIVGWVILIMVALVSLFIVVDRRKNYYSMVRDNSDIEIKIRYKGLKKSVDFTMDDNSIYVAFPSRIQCIPLVGEPYDLIRDDEYDIKSVECVGEKLFFISKCNLYSIYTKTGEVEECLSNIPSNGEYKDVLMKGYGDYLYISIGAATNSGVPDSSDICDLPPFDIKMKDNAIVKAGKVGNSCIIQLDVNSMKYTTYAWGIRNVEGMDITSDGRIFTTVGGMENRGIRPVYGDSDYVYEIKKGCWYGFPDFSGGEPINSPKFKNENGDVQEPIMSEYPMNPLAPLYQHDSVGSLKWLAIDSSGTINGGGKNDIYIYDRITKEILCGGIGGAPLRFAIFNGDTNITSIKIENESLYILDSSKGILYTLNRKDK